VLLPLALLAVLPAVLLWAAAIAQSIGLGHPLDRLPAPASAATRLDRLLLLGAVWMLSLGGPLAAFAGSLLALVDAELRVEPWELSARLRLPAPPWERSQVTALLLLALGALLFAAMAGHLAADCLLGGDCPSL
jgi:hypothetical protein